MNTEIKKEINYQNEVYDSSSLESKSFFKGIKFEKKKIHPLFWLFVIYAFFLFFCLIENFLGYFNKS